MRLPQTKHMNIQLCQESLEDKTMVSTCRTYFNDNWEYASAADEFTLTSYSVICFPPRNTHDNSCKQPFPPTWSLNSVLHAYTTQQIYYLENVDIYSTCHNDFSNIETSYTCNLNVVYMLDRAVTPECLPSYIVSFVIVFKCESYKCQMSSCLIVHSKVNRVQTKKTKKKH